MIDLNLNLNLNFTLSLNLNVYVNQLQFPELTWAMNGSAGVALHVDYWVFINDWDIWK